MGNLVKLNLTYEFSTDYKLLYELICKDMYILGIATNPRFNTLDFVHIKIQDIGIKTFRLQYFIESATVDYSLGYQSEERFIVMCERIKLRFILPNHSHLM